MEPFRSLWKLRNNDVLRIKTHHSFYSSLQQRTEKKKKKQLFQGKDKKRALFNTITISKGLPRKYFQLPTQQFSKDFLTQKKKINGKEIIRRNLTVAYTRAGSIEHIIAFHSLLALEAPEIWPGFPTLWPYEYQICSIIIASGPSGLCPPQPLLWSWKHAGSRFAHNTICRS